MITIAEIERWIDALPPVEIEVLDCSEPEPGRAPLRRLTSTEYKFSVQDLLGIDVDPTAGFPAEEEALGFDNNADALNVSRLLAEKYFEAGEIAGEAAVQNIGDLLAHLNVDCGGARVGCIEDLARALAKRAYRRPLDEDEVGRLMAIFEYGRFGLREGGGNLAADWHEGIKLVIASILQSPYFLYRIEFGVDPTDRAATTVKLTDYEMAARLSFFLWASMPDPELFAAAERGELRTLAQVEAQARRMVEDVRAQRAVTHFYTQWLGLRGLSEVEKQTRRFPNWNPQIAQGMVDEVISLATHLTWTEEAGIDDLFTTSTTFLDGPLADFYGISGVEGDALQQVELDPAQRRGIITRGGVMAALAKADQGSPILRGVFVRERILCQQLPNPPDDVDNSPPEVSADDTTRERFVAHTAVESCAACHRLIDPIGFTFEAFDGVGQFRTQENRSAIDTTGEIVDTESLDGTYADSSALTAALAGNDEVRRCVIRQWFRYANGRVEAEADACSMDQLWSHLSTQNFSLKELLVTMTQTNAFMYRPVGGGQ